MTARKNRPRTARNHLGRFIARSLFARSHGQPLNPLPEPIAPPPPDSQPPSDPPEPFVEAEPLFAGMLSSGYSLSVPSGMVKPSFEPSTPSSIPSRPPGPEMMHLPASPTLPITVFTTEVASVPNPEIGGTPPDGNSQSLTTCPLERLKRLSQGLPSSSLYSFSSSVRLSVYGWLTTLARWTIVDVPSFWKKPVYPKL